MRVCNSCGVPEFSVLEKKILKFLKGKELSERELAEKCGVSLMGVFYSVKVLEKANLVKTKKVSAKRGIKKVVWLQSKA